METHMENNKMLYSHVSVDCVLLGVNEDKLCVLLVERKIDKSDEKHYKLPGSLILRTKIWTRLLTVYLMKLQV